ncbi:hypothetical protein [Piscinibacter sakaiensis]|uniref:hypothetical protein n=1 Tax=Piscinibacter sakaiensis TaxID=1547922 RepID=UPI003AB00393
MRMLDAKEVQQVSGGAPKKWQKITPEQRADPGEDVTPALSVDLPGLPGNRTGWCRGYGNMKNGEPKHEGTNCGLM